MHSGIQGLVLFNKIPAFLDILTVGRYSIEFDLLAKDHKWFINIKKEHSSQHCFFVCFLPLS